MAKRTERAEAASDWSHVVAQAWKDPDFKQELLNNPKNTLEKALGVKLPRGVTFRIIEDTATTVTLVLPALPDDFTPGGPSDAELREMLAMAKTDVRSGDRCCTKCPKLPQTRTTN
jgi:hypothetical protein